MENVWLDLKSESGKYIAKKDKKFIDKFLNNEGGKHDLELGVIPQHFIGDIKNAKLLILSLILGSFTLNAAKTTSTYTIKKSTNTNINIKRKPKILFGANLLYLKS